MGEPAALIRTVLGRGRYPGGVGHTSSEPERRAWPLAAALLTVLVLGGQRAAGQADPAPIQDPGKAETAPPGPLGPRRPVDGLRGLVTHSTLEFVGHARPHGLAAVFVFPDRARWRIEPRGGDEAARRMRFRYGEHTFGIEPGQATSRTLEGAEGAACVLQMELRRAATLWPHGFEWQGEGRLRSADLGKSGRLIALLGTALERPVELTSLRADGRPLETYREIRWREADARGRRWPASWDLVVEGRIIWHETITRVDTPPVAGKGRILPVDMPRRVQRRFPLEGPGWDAARQQAEALWVEWRAGGDGPRLDERPAIELDRRARPVAVLLQLADPLADVPEGWTARPGCPGMAALVDGTERINPALLQRLIDRSPPGAKRGAPLVRLTLGPPDPLGFQVFLPLRPGED